MLSLVNAKADSPDYVGQILASGVSIPFGRMPTDWSWRSPLLLQALPAVINAGFILFLPESPRWLYTRGKKDQAIEILARLHSKDMDINSPLIKLEIEEIEVNISVDGSDKRWWDFRALFSTFGNRYRMLSLFYAIGKEQESKSLY